LKLKYQTTAEDRAGHCDGDLGYSSIVILDLFTDTYRVDIQGV
jgi:hypothetical protein